MSTELTRISDQHLRHLSEVDGSGPIVSVFLAPTRDTLGQHAAEQRLEALAREGRRALCAAPWNLEEGAAKALLEPIITEMAEVERGPDESLACFVAAGWSRMYLVAGDTPDRVTVASRVDLLPVIEALGDDVEFHLLTLTQDHVRLFRCDAIGWHRLHSVDLPESRADALWFEHYEQASSIHGGNHVGRDQIAGMVHGSGSHKEQHKEATERFVRAVDRALPVDVHDGEIPLVVVAVEYEASLFRDVRPHTDLVLITELGSPERLPMTRVHECAVDLLRSRRRVARASLVDRFRSLDGTGLTVHGFADAIEAARRGSVDVVIIPSSGPSSGGELNGADRRSLLDVAAAAIQTGGSITFVDDGLEAIAPVAAILRY